MLNTPGEFAQIPLDRMISAAMRLPRTRINRSLFLREQFKRKPDSFINEVSVIGPISMGCSRNTITKAAYKLIFFRNSSASGMSFPLILPAGMLMPDAVPTIVAKFYGIALRMAQELCYLYGADDLWAGENAESETLRDKFTLLCGVMLNFSGAAEALRLIIRSRTEDTLSRIPGSPSAEQLTHAVAESVVAAFSRVLSEIPTDEEQSEPVAFAGGAIADGIVFLSISSMGGRLTDSLDMAVFAPSDEVLQSDTAIVAEIYSDYLEKQKSQEEAPNILGELERAKKLLDSGAITKKEFAAIKAELLSKL